MKTVLIIEDSMYMRTLIRIALKRAGYEVIGEATDGESGMAMYDRFKPDLITLDNILPDMFGIEVLKHFADLGISKHVVMISAVNQDTMRKQAELLGAGGYVSKPFESVELIAVMDQVSGSLEVAS